MPLDFESIVRVAHRFARGEGRKRLPDAEIMALYCAWDGISYDEFIANQLEYHEKYSYIYKNPGKLKSRSTLPASSCAVMRLFERNLNLTDLNQGNLQRKLLKLYENKDSHFYKLITDFSENKSEIYPTGNIDKNSISSVEINRNSLDSHLTNKAINNNQELFIGRKNDLNKVVELLEVKPVIVLQGFHGIGKTYFLDHLSSLLRDTFTPYYTDFGYINTFEEWLVSLLSLSGKADYKSGLPQLLSDVFHFLESSKSLIILDSVGILSKDFLSFLESFTLNKLSSRIIISSSYPISLNLPLKYYSKYELKGLSNKEDINKFFDHLGLKDKNSWVELSNQYSGNFRELIYVSKFIKDFYRGRVSEYLSVGSRIISPNLKDFLSSIEYTDLDAEIFSICSEKKAILSSSLMEFLRKQKSSSEIFSRITFLANHGFLETTLVDESDVICYSLSPLVESFLMHKDDKNE